MSELVATIGLCLMVVEMGIFLATYVIYSPWWVSPLGKIYAAKTTLMSLVLLQNAASVLSSSDYPFRHEIRAAIYIGGAIAMIALWVMLRRFQREGIAARAAAGDTRSRRQVWADTLRELAHRHDERTPSPTWRDPEDRPPL